jgi:hypothetical protein
MALRRPLIAQRLIGLTAVIDFFIVDVRFTPESGHVRRNRASTGHNHRNRTRRNTATPPAPASAPIILNKLTGKYSERRRLI